MEWSCAVGDDLSCRSMVSAPRRQYALMYLGCNEQFRTCSYYLRARHLSACPVVRSGVVLFVVFETAKRLDYDAIDVGDGQRRTATTATGVNASVAVWVCDSNERERFGGYQKERMRCECVCRGRRRGCGCAVEHAECGAVVSRARTAAEVLGRTSHGWRGRKARRAIEQQSGQQSVTIAVLQSVVLLRRGCFQDAPARCILGQPSEHHPC